MTPVTRLNITLDPETIMRIEQIQEATGANRSEILRRAVLAYFRELSGTNLAAVLPVSSVKKKRTKK